MAEKNNLEVWLRGPIADIHWNLQPVAHALLQAREEVNELTNNFNEDLLWKKPGPVATAGFHLQHLTGVLDRLFTYARGEALNTEQLKALAQESQPDVAQLNLIGLVQNFNNQVDKAIAQLKQTDSNQLSETRLVGRAKIPSTVLGLLFHAAEHTQRHLGQLLVTVKVLESSSELQ
ncbi:DinB family protein [Adhaeribacter radiodurans]|uniref:DinB family protein n=1 Tax=Adhaeribacter radiodurans TaxID=2745197 RepID=A0A7L7L7D4_9BACT|nr:DinB family protein [Adhaeribacter radiodurans]QMU28445.1 DinB family protein [Adhaeribacter radiodurans]